ncbi:MAG: RNA-directed DNA polymerase [Massilibacteroides sp.]|nr:RNA-directed DNA polymerase [Massilibacteroides sp.]
MDLLEDIFQAYYEARRHKRNTVNQLRFEIDLEENLIALYEEIRDRKYTIGHSTCFMVDYPVKREVFAADFRDRVVHHLVVGYLNSFIERQLIYDCYSCRKGKGTLFGINRLEHHIRSCSENFQRECYVLKLDLKGYFMRINRKKLSAFLNRIILRYADCKDKNGVKFRDSYRFDLLTYLLPVILYNDPTGNCVFKGKPSDWDGLPPSKSLFHSPKDCGLPIGNLTSQLFSNVYLNAFDQYVKRELKVRHYGRYVDDFFLIDRDKKRLLDLLPKIRDYLEESVGVQLHPNKIYLQRIDKGVCFLGTYLKPFRRYILNRTVGHFVLHLKSFDRWVRTKNVRQEELEQMRAVMNSYLGVLQRTRTYRIKRKLFSFPCELFRYGYLNGRMEIFVLYPDYKRRDDVVEG